MAQASSIEEKKKLEAIEKRETDVRKNLLSTGMIIRYTLIFIMVVSIKMFSDMVSTEEGQIAQFDPFKILGIPSDASDKDVKKAYRGLSMTFHPDRWVTSTKAEQALASAKFMKISKAYEALTDEVAKNNYKLYGNPDGRQALEVSVGLPAWLVDKGNQNFVLFFYLVIFIGVIPGLVAVYYARSRRYAERSILQESLEVLNFYIKNNPKVKSLPEALALCAEFRKLRERSEQESKLLFKLFTRMVEEEKLSKPTPQMRKAIDGTPGSMKVLVLLHAHLNRITSELTPELKTDLEFILRSVPMLLDEMLKIALSTLNFRTVHAVIKLGQHIFQALYFTDSPLLQLPHMTENEVKHAAGASGGGRNKKQQAVSQDGLSGLASYGLDQYAKSIPLTGKTTERRKGLAEMSEAQAKEVEEVLHALPTLTKVTVRLGTPKEMDLDSALVLEWEPKILQGDTAAAFTKICFNAGWSPESESEKGSEDKPTLESLKDVKARREKSPQFAHTPYFPGAMEEKWYVVVTGGPAPVGGEKMYPSGPDRMLGFEETLREAGEKMIYSVQRFRTLYTPYQWHSSANFAIGKNGVSVHLLSACYVKFDQTIDLDMLIDKKSKEDEIEQHPDDLAIGNAPTLWDEVLRPGNYDSDFEDEEDKAAQQKDLQVNDEESEDEDDGGGVGKVKTVSKKNNKSKSNGKASATTNVEEEAEEAEEEAFKGDDIIGDDDFE
jgi:curved DNA-binding protein CbpA